MTTELALRILKVLDKNSRLLADELRREYSVDLTNLNKPTDEEKQRIGYVSMH